MAKKKLGLDWANHLGVQPVRLLVSVRAYQPTNSVFPSQQTSTSRAYQPRNQPANMLVMYTDDASVVVQTLQRIASRLVMTNLDKTFSVSKKEMCCPT